MNPKFPQKSKTQSQFLLQEAIVEDNIDNNKVLKPTDNNQLEKISDVAE